ncbi:MAG TPA: adenylate/guanylate cyclase domain-containing protein, partial [Gaiellaceae bacterium]
MLVRKTVTVLFCDVTESTRLGESLDPETHRRVMSRYFEEMSAALEAHGGTVEKFIGDAVMAVFGVPTVHEDDALRAVRAAAEMRERLSRLNEELEPAYGISLEMRTGVNTGEVVAGDASGHSLVTGDAVVVAKRLEEAAPPGQILIGKATYPLVQNAIDAGPLQTFSAKGKSEGVPSRRVDDVRSGAGGIARRLEAPLVGRDEELAGLLRELERVSQERSCRLVTLLGPAGIGKSRLARELLDAAGAYAT